VDIITGIDQESKLTAYSRAHILGIFSLVLFNMAFLILLWNSLHIFIVTGSLIISLTMPTLFLCGTALLGIRKTRRRVNKRSVDPKTRTALMRLEKDDRFVRRMDTVFFALIPIGYLFVSPVLSQFSLRPTFESAMPLVLVLGSIFVPSAVEIKAMATDSIGGRIDAWVALVAILSIDATYLIYGAFTRRFIMPMLVPHIVDQGSFGAIFGILDMGIPLLVTLSFGKRLMSFYRRSLVVRDKEIPRQFQELLLKTILLLTAFSYVCTVVYSTIF